MPKRKRSVDEELDEKLTELKQELFRALKAAKGLERQRLSKRIHEAKSSPDKVERLNREVTALKTIDLQQTAHAHLASSLTKIKAVAELPALPDDYKEGPPKKALSEQDRLALHNVTSGLYSRPAVREVADKAIRVICMTLDVPIPEKKARGNKGDSNTNTKADAKSEDGAHTKTKSAAGRDPPAKKRRVADDAADDAASASDSFHGFSDRDDDGRNAGDLGEDDEEAALSKMADMLGSSDDEEEHVETMRAKYSALLGQQPDTEDADDESDDVDDLDDLEEMDQDEDEPDEAESESESEEQEQEQDDQQGMNSERRRMLEADAAPPPAAPARQPKEPKPVKAGATTFLPSLMGGYFSGSESASDVDVAPPKKRLGQRQRQAIAERKHGEMANHVRNEKKKKQQGGRDDGWDMKRGAVDSAEGKGRKPWMKEGAGEKEGAKGAKGAKGGHAPRPVMNRKERRRLKMLSKDDQGELHPSWQARKREKEALQSAAFQGTKITF
ncbi:hypothetical protein VD0003_g4288 [Verticillium dahliae]|nr:hypothetical protein VD0003_g4288 [Verticillium dahliae]